MSKPESIDLFGLKPLATAVEKMGAAAVEGAAAFLGRICLPVAEECGLLLRDKVSAWRAANTVAIAVKAQRRHAEQNIPEGHHAHPRLVGHILEHGSWVDSDVVQELWAGLLASSCSGDGQDDSNLMFVDLLGRLTVSQVKVLDYACQHAPKRITSTGLIVADQHLVDLPSLVELSGVADVQRLDRELDHLRALGLLDFIFGGLSTDEQIANVAPSSLALHMYARCNGVVGDSVEFYKTRFGVAVQQDESP